MKHFKHLTTITIIFVLLFFLFTKSAYAYLDPGSGSFIFQILIATVVGASFAIKLYWRKIKTFFANVFSKGQNVEKNGD